MADILYHIRGVHPHFKGKVKCIVSNCPSTLSSYESLRHHMYKKHKDQLKDDCSTDIVTITEDEIAYEDVVELHTVEHSYAQAESDEPTYHYEVSKFILKIYEGKKLTQSVTVGRIVDYLKKKVFETLNMHSGQIKDKLDELEEIFKSPVVQNLFSQLQT